MEIQALDFASAPAFCPECGVLQSTDEDGCCLQCGATARGTALVFIQATVAELLQALNQERTARNRIAKENADRVAKEEQAHRDGVQQHSRELEELAQLEWIELILGGQDVSDFALSFGLVRAVWDLKQQVRALSASSTTTR